VLVVFRIRWLYTKAPYGNLYMIFVWGCVPAAMAEQQLFTLANESAIFGGAFKSQAGGVVTFGTV